MTGADVLRIRERMGLSQSELAHALGAHPQTISDWERGAKPIGWPLMLDLALRWLEYVRARE